MPRILYTQRKFGAENRAIIDHANAIIAEYTAAGYSLTLRQLYYQFVARDLLGNTVQNYKRLGSIISDARRAGLVDWNAIVDRTRNLQKSASWDNPSHILEAVASQYKLDPWLRQDTYVEVWYEKDALMGVFERVCQTWRLPSFSCRGYTSDSEIWSAAQRLVHVRRGTTPHSLGKVNRGRDIVILHFGDHDRAVWT